MKLNKKLEADILKVYNTYWDSYFKGDMRAFASLLHENVQLIGSSENEVFSNKRSAMKFYKATAGQVAGKAGVRNRKITMQLVGNNALVIEQSDFYVLIDNEWSFYGNGRISTLLQKTDTGWKIIHEHGSLPDSKAGEGEQVNTERIKAENLQLREAVKRRTIELEVKNHELEIETALERVRVVATGMKNPEDMLDVCKTISLQLESLGIKEIRNVQTAIFYEQRGTYMNYEYYAKHKKDIITETIYTNNKIHKAFALKMLKGKGESFITHIKGKKVKEWIAYQTTTNVFIDKYLNKASSLNYYWFSLGPVALGISTYHPLTEEEINLFRRFLKVFELAYRRYLDIEKAEAQAREAKIEAALEKVRSRSLAMHKSNELQDVVDTVFEKLKDLKINMNVASIFIFKEGSKDWEQWVVTSTTSYSTYFHIPYTDNLVFRDLEEAKQKRKDFYSVRYSFEQKNKWFKYAFKNTEYRQVPDYRKKYILESKFFLVSFALSKHSGIQIAKYEGKDFSQEENEILKRFSRVFEQTYTRFLDLQKAEAQAKEAQIQLALERVRARTMAMQHSDELKEAAALLFQQVQNLGVKPWSCGYCIWNKDKTAVTAWMSPPQGGIQPPIILPMKRDSSLKLVLEAHQRGGNFFIQELSGKALADEYNFLITKVPGFKELVSNSKNAGFSIADFSSLSRCFLFQRVFALYYLLSPALKHMIFLNALEKSFNKPIPVSLIFKKQKYR